MLLRAKIRQENSARDLKRLIAVMTRVKVAEQQRQ